MAVQRLESFNHVPTQPVGDYVIRDERRGVNVLTFDGSGDAGLVEQLAAPRLVTYPTGFVPTVTATGIGATGTAVMGTSSADMAGQVVLTPAGAGIAALGTVTVTFSTGSGAYGALLVVVVAMLRNNTGTWDPRATIIGSTFLTTSFILNWDNNGVALTAAQAYQIQYVAVGR